MSVLNSSKQNSGLPRAVIFGAGNAGQSAFANLNSQFNIIGFVDNDSSKHGNLLFGLPIHSIQEIEKDNCLILVASEFYEQIKAQLIRNKSIDGNRISSLPARHLKPMAFANDYESIGLEVLKTLCNVLESSSITYHLDAGTLLGLYRDGQLIPWDDDLDIAIDARDLINIEKTFATLLAALHQVTATQWRITKHITSQSFGNVPEGVIRSFKLDSLTGKGIPAIDLFVKYVGGKYSDYCLASRGIRMPSKYVKNTKLETIADVQYRIPADTEGYLTCHYGKTWHIPNPDWSLQDLGNTKVFDV